TFVNREVTSVHATEALPAVNPTALRVCGLKARCTSCPAPLASARRARVPPSIELHTRRTLEPLDARKGFVPSARITADEPMIPAATTRTDWMVFVVVAHATRYA